MGSYFRPDFTTWISYILVPFLHFGHIVLAISFLAMFLHFWPHYIWPCSYSIWSHYFWPYLYIFGHGFARVSMACSLAGKLLGVTMMALPSLLFLAFCPFLYFCPLLHFPFLPLYLAVLAVFCGVKVKPRVALGGVTHFCVLWPELYNCPQLITEVKRVYCSGKLGNTQSTIFLELSRH